MDDAVIEKVYTLPLVAEITDLFNKRNVSIEEGILTCMAVVKTIVDQSETAAEREEAKRWFLKMFEAILDAQILGQETEYLN